VFCTLLFVTDPILIFIPTVILQHLFAVQARRKQRTEKANAAESLAVLATERDVYNLDRTKVHTNQSAPEPFRPTTNNTTSINDEESETTSKFGMK
jgi:hypothetical protein